MMIFYVIIATVSYESFYSLVFLQIVLHARIIVCWVTVIIIDK
jgi:hypothetical protein